MNIYDCFMYFDEDLLLDIRLNILNDYVSKFVITEATYAHNGAKKKLKFDVNNFKKFKEKIEYIVVDTQPSNILSTDKEDDEKKKTQDAEIETRKTIRDANQQTSNATKNKSQH